MIRSYVLRLALLLCVCTASSHVMTMGPGGAPVEIYDDSFTYFVPAFIETATMTMVAGLPLAMKYLPFKKALLHTLELAVPNIIAVGFLAVPNSLPYLFAGVGSVMRPLGQWERPDDKYWLAASVIMTGLHLARSRYSLLEIISTPPGPI